MIKSAFISYSRKDQRFAKKLARDLKARGIDVWIDQSDIRGGDDWLKEITDAINERQAFIIILSPNSIKSKYVKREFRYADNKNKKIFPIDYKSHTLPDEMGLVLNPIQFANFKRGPYAQNLKRFLNTLAGKEDTFRPPPPPLLDRIKRINWKQPSAWAWVAGILALTVLLVWGIYQIIPSPTPTSTPTAATTQAAATEDLTPTPCTNQATFLDDITYPDGAEVDRNEVFTKTWLLQNSGTCVWTPDYAAVFVSEFQMGAPNEIPLGTTVQPGEEFELSIEFTAPGIPECYQSNLILRDDRPAAYEFFGINTPDQTIWVRVSVGKNRCDK